MVRYQVVMVFDIGVVGWSRREKTVTRTVLYPWYFLGRIRDRGFRIRRSKNVLYIPPGRLMRATITVSK